MFPVSLAVPMKVSLMYKSRCSPPQPVPFLFQAFYYDLDKVRLLGLECCKERKMGDFLSAVLPKDTFRK